jgi:hypothetical protein
MKVSQPKVFGFTSDNYEIQDDGSVRNLSLIRRATVDSVVGFSELDPLRVIEVTDIPSVSFSVVSYWFRIYCSGLPEYYEPAGFKFFLINPDCSKYMLMFNHNTVEKHTSVEFKLTPYDREILLLAIDQYMSKL